MKGRLITALAIASFAAISMRASILEEFAELLLRHHQLAWFVVAGWSSQDLDLERHLRVLDILKRFERVPLALPGSDVNRFVVGSRRRAELLAVGLVDYRDPILVWRVIHAIEDPHRETLLAFGLPVVQPADDSAAVLEVGANRTTPHY